LFAFVRVAVGGLSERGYVRDVSDRVKNIFFHHLIMSIKEGTSPVGRTGRVFEGGPGIRRRMNSRKDGENDRE
jgi:hypothetical protein